MSELAARDERPWKVQERPEREIPAVIETLRERLDSLLKHAFTLRERLLPVCTPSNPEGKVGAPLIRQSQIGAQIGEAVEMASQISTVLADIQERLEL